MVAWTRVAPAEVAEVVRCWAQFESRKSLQDLPWFGGEAPERGGPPAPVGTPVTSKNYGFGLQSGSHFPKPLKFPRCGVPARCLL